MKHSLLFSITVSLLLSTSCSSSPDDSNNSTTVTEIEKITTLDDKIDETSGLIYFDNSFWTINDSGNKPFLFRIDETNGNVIQTIKLSNAQNKDWEDLSQDDTHIYIADTGNNNGERKTFQIYKIAKADIPAEEDATVTADLIEFEYEDQPSSSFAYAHDFDCEALTIWNDQLSVFTKNWKSNNTNLYVINNTTGVAKKVASFETDGLVTGANYNKSNDTAYLIGYKKNGDKEPFIFKISSFSQKPATSHFILPDIAEYQTEGICFHNDFIYITNESNGASEQSLLRISLPD